MKIKITHESEQWCIDENCTTVFVYIIKAREISARGLYIYAPIIMTVCNS